MLKDLGVDYVIMGHSERREYNNETDAETVNLKAKKALLKRVLFLSFAAVSLNSVKPVSQWTDCYSNQEGICRISADDAKKVVVAYEPIWAIGTALLPTTKLEEVCGGIRELLENLYDAETAKAITIQWWRQHES